MYKPKHLSGLGAIVALTAALAFAPAAQATHVVPVEVEATATCPDGYTLITRFDPAYAYSKDGITQVRPDDWTLDWTSTVAVDIVIVKGGRNAYQYTYDADTFGDTGLVAPRENRISWVEYCTNDAPSIDFTILKTGVEQTATAGTTVNFTITVTNTGNTSFSTYTFDDPGCEEKRTGANAGDDTFDPGDTWTYSCAMATTAGQTKACNTATLTGQNSHGMTAGPKSSEACIPLTPPAATKPPPTGTTVPAVPPAGGTLPAAVRSGRARLSGPSGCIKQAFRARVTGRSIAVVSFWVDGKRVKRLTGERSVYAVKIRPSKYGFGRHRVIARVRFTAESGTAPRRLPLTFRRCARGAVAPRFTG
jgi:hypothetical protein